MNVKHVHIPHTSPAHNPMSAFACISSILLRAGASLPSIRRAASGFFTNIRRIDTVSRLIGSMADSPEPEEAPSPTVILRSSSPLHGQGS